MTDEELVKALRDFDETRDFIPPPTIQLDAADAIERLTRERDEARAGNHSADEHEPTWAELTYYWKHRAEAAMQTVEKLREALRDIA